MKIILISLLAILQASITLGQNVFPSSGNVGIGTLTPLVPLEVRGDILISNSNIPMGLNTEVHGNSPIFNMSINFRGANLNHNYLGASFRIDSRATPGGLPLFQWINRDPGTGQVGEKVIMSLTQSGNLGIGILVPGERLSVNGNIRAKEIKVEVNDWPDYVLKTDYELLTLQEIDSFIKINGHLPGIPKAQIIEENGLPLGEMNKLLMKKVEELTLYLIERDRKISKLEAINNQQNCRLEKIEEIITIKRIVRKKMGSHIAK